MLGEVLPFMRTLTLNPKRFLISFFVNKTLSDSHLLEYPYHKC